jgi:hypothetical protein
MYCLYFREKGLLLRGGEMVEWGGGFGHPSYIVKKCPDLDKYFLPKIIHVKGTYVNMLCTSERLLLLLFGSQSYVCTGV